MRKNWVTEANKYGVYLETYRGFRIYCIQEPTHQEREEIRDGALWNVTDFAPGKYIAVNKTGEKVRHTHPGDIYPLINIQIIKDWCQYKCTQSGNYYTSE